ARRAPLPGTARSAAGRGTGWRRAVVGAVRWAGDSARFPGSDASPRGVRAACPGGAASRTGVGRVGDAASGRLPPRVGDGAAAGQRGPPRGGAAVFAVERL